ncbi:MAG: hypothetical protein QF903_06450 [Planctomycetota bacterium]|jgi:acetyl-CoA carboxylase biotin carboxyl carrier protein|nr:hypothetical protein [Planctomycetota bacterium]MDP6762112.1 hypothetical protein [Planctomycetota bacterium]MDP6989101.1 hypothetical protein [Planctomycetota bacterium]
MSGASLELLVERTDTGCALRSPGVGTFTCPRPRGAVIGEGEGAGVLRVLGREVTLLVPSGVLGRVANDPPTRVRAPVAYRDLLYELEALVDVEAAASRVGTPDAAVEGGLVLRAPQTGRFYHRPGPDRPPYLVAGAELAAGVPVGLIEVMKTFTQIAYRAADGLPERARFVRWLAEDGAEVTAGDALLVLESA